MVFESLGTGIRNVRNCIYFRGKGKNLRNGQKSSTKVNSSPSYQELQNQQKRQNQQNKQITRHNHINTKMTALTILVEHHFLSFCCYVLFHVFFLCFLYCSYLDHPFPHSLWPSIFSANFHGVQGAQDSKILQLNNSDEVMLVGKNVTEARIT